MTSRRLCPFVQHITAWRNATDNNRAGARGRRTAACVSTGDSGGRSIIAAAFTSSRQYDAHTEDVSPLSLTSGGQEQRLSTELLAGAAVPTATELVVLLWRATPAGWCMESYRGEQASRTNQHRSDRWPSAACYTLTLLPSYTWRISSLLLQQYTVSTHRALSRSTNAAVQSLSRKREERWRRLRRYTHAWTRARSTNVGPHGSAALGELASSRRPSPPRDTPTTWPPSPPPPLSLSLSLFSLPPPVSSQSARHLPPTSRGTTRHGARVGARVAWLAGGIVGVWSARAPALCGCVCTATTTTAAADAAATVPAGRAAALDRPLTRSLARRGTGER